MSINVNFGATYPVSFIITPAWFLPSIQSWPTSNAPDFLATFSTSVLEWQLGFHSLLIDVNANPAMAGFNEAADERRLFVRADEVDQLDTPITPSAKQFPFGGAGSLDSSTATASRPIQTKASSGATFRPLLRREGSAPPPPSQPPPAAPQQVHGLGNPTDSLSLPQLKQLVNQFPKVEQRAYAFQFADAQSYSFEVEEWFHYTRHDQVLLLSSRDGFESKWKTFCVTDDNLKADEPSWLEVDQTIRSRFLSQMIEELQSQDIQAKIMALESIMYILCGVWALTAGLEGDVKGQADAKIQDGEHPRRNSIQVHWMHLGADLLGTTLRVEALFQCTQKSFEADE